MRLSKTPTYTTDLTHDQQVWMRNEGHKPMPRCMMGIANINGFVSHVRQQAPQLPSLCCVCDQHRLPLLPPIPQPQFSFQMMCSWLPSFECAVSQRLEPEGKSARLIDPARI